MVRLPDLDDLLQIAALVNDVGSAEVRERVHPERAALALHRPGRFKGQQPKYGEVAAKAGALFLALLEAGFDDDRDNNLRCSYLAMKLTVQLNGRQWKKQHGDREAVLRIRNDPREISFEAFATWVERHIGDEIEVEDGPDLHVHLTSRVWQIASDDGALKKVCDAASAEIDEFSRTSTHIDVFLRPLRPIDNTWPTAPKNEVFGVEERLLFADGLISFGLAGGSYGAGEDRCFAAGGPIPMLHLQPEEEDLSPRDESWMRRQGVRIRRYPTRCPEKEMTAVVRGHVGHWLREEVGRLYDAKRHEAINLARMRPLFDTLVRARDELPVTVYRQHLADTWITEARADDLLSDPRRFARAVATEQLDLSTALGVAHTIDIPPLPPYHPEEPASPLLADALGAMSEVIEMEQLTAQEVIEVMALADARFGRGMWSMALNKRQTILPLAREIRKHA